MKTRINKVCHKRTNIYVICCRLYFNPAMLTNVDATNKTPQDGDFVCVIDSYEKVKALQDAGHGGWKEKMREVIIISFPETFSEDYAGVILLVCVNSATNITCYWEYSPPPLVT